MPMVKFPYTKEGEKNAKAAAREYGGKYISDKKDKGGGGASIMIAVGSPVKKRKKSHLMSTRPNMPNHQVSAYDRRVPRNS